MSSPAIQSAMPQAVLLGIQDESTQQVTAATSQYPTHLPKVYLYAQKGPTTPQLVSGAGMTQMYGTDTFDLRKPFATHQTVLSNVLSAKANAQMIERVLPDDIGPKANFLLSLDLLPTNVPLYQRNADGTYVTNAVTGLPVPQMTNNGTQQVQALAPGFIGKFVITSQSTFPMNGATVGTAANTPDSQMFGVAVSGPGDQTGNNATSTRYPLLEFWASSFGSYANNAGFRIYAPTSNNNPNTSIFNGTGAFPFRLSAISRVTSNSTPTVNSTIGGDAYLDFVLQSNVINPNTDAQVSLGDVLPAAFSSIGVAGFQDIYADLGNFFIYQDNVNLVTSMIYSKENDFNAGNPGSDFTGATDQTWMVNLLGAQSSTGAPYATYVFNTQDGNSVSLSPSTNLYASGASDGTMNEALFASLVTTAVTQYLDPLSELNDTAVNVESIIYDTGFPLATKKALVNFISQRKDTFVVLSTYDVNGGPMLEADEASVGISLLTQLQLYPESSYYGTPVVRGLIMGRYGNLTGSQYTKQLPLTIELASKSAAFMGASNGIWNPVYLFDMANDDKSSGTSEVTMFNNVNITYTPPRVRNTDWANGLNYPISYSRDSLFFPALKTVYDNDTSVLTSYLVAMVCVQCEKVGEAAWRKFSGQVRMTPAQLVDAVNQFVVNETQGVFAGLVKIIPAAYISGGDAQRGYSWSLPIKVYGNNSTTVEEVTIQVYRRSSLAA